MGHAQLCSPGEPWTLTRATDPTVFTGSIAAAANSPITKGTPVLPTVHKSSCRKPGTETLESAQEFPRSKPLYAAILVVSGGGAATQTAEEERDGGASGSHFNPMAMRLIERER